MFSPDHNYIAVTSDLSSIDFYKPTVFDHLVITNPRSLQETAIIALGLAQIFKRSVLFPDSDTTVDIGYARNAIVVEPVGIIHVTGCSCEICSRREPSAGIVDTEATATELMNGVQIPDSIQAIINQQLATLLITYQRPN